MGNNVLERIVLSRERQRGIQPAVGIIKKGAELTAHALIPKYHIVGIEHLEEIRTLLQNGKRVVFASNHISNADFPAIEDAIRRNGFPDLSARLLPLYGEKLERSLGTWLFAHAYRRLPVWSPYLEAKTEDERKKKVDMNIAAIRGVHRALPRGDVLVIFPEATRSETGELRRGVPELAVYVVLADVIVPVTLLDTDKVMPRSGKHPSRHSVTIYFGPAKDVTLLKQEYHELEGEEKQQAIVDDLMISIGRPLPESRRGAYRDQIV